MSSKAVITSDVKTLIKNNMRNYSMFIVLVFIMLIFAFLTKGVNFNPRNFTNIFFQNSYVLILATGMVMIIITQNIDLSVGSACAFIGMLSATVYNTGIGMPATIIVSILIGILIGAYQGAWVAFGKMPAFIVTLSGMLLFRGLTYGYSLLRTGGVSPVSLKDTNYALFAKGILDEIIGIENRIGPYFPMAFVVAILLLAVFFIAEFAGRRRKIANEFEVTPLPLFITKLVLISLLVLGLADRFARYRGLPIIVLVLGVTIFAFHFILNNTVLGRYIYAVGGNPRSAKLSGINSEMITFIVFCFIGGLAGLAAVAHTGDMGTALPQAGNLFELDAIAACYIGGVSAGGGIGTVIGVIVGGLVMAAINNGMVLMNLGAHYQYVVKALVLVLAVFYDIYTRRKAGLG
ncbi:MAG: sugar ABC transporter permease [Treponema sp.]|nr:sugar ABC transporter permease [Treponema sp.]